MMRHYNQFLELYLYRYFGYKSLFWLWTNFVRKSPLLSVSYPCLSLYEHARCMGDISLLLSCFSMVQYMYHSHYSLLFHLRNVQCGRNTGQITARHTSAKKRRENHYPFKIRHNRFIFRAHLTTFAQNKNWRLILYVNNVH